MPQDAFTIRYVTKELCGLLKGGKISKIIQPDRETVTFIIYTASGNVKLDACLSARGCRLSLTGCDKPVPKTAPGFCMLLRKHLANAQITGVAQIPFERIVYFDFDCTSEFEKLKMRLYVELMGKYSNAVLTQNGVILGALKTAAIGENTKRVLFPGVKYSLPEPQDKISPDDTAAIKEALKNSPADKAEFISQRIKGVAYSTAADIAETFNNNPAAEEIKEYLCGDEYSPCVTYADGEPADFKARCASADKRDFPDILSAQREFYDFVYKKQLTENARKELTGAVFDAEKKLRKRLQAINEKLLDCRDAETVKLKGELLTANLYAVERGRESFEAVNYYDENGGKIKIALDRSLTPSQNAQKYFKRYAKLKRTQEISSAQREETEKKLDYLSSIRAHICAAESLFDLAETREELKANGLIKEPAAKKEKAVVTPFRKYIIGGFTVLAGRNNIQNDRLLKHIRPDDMWLHTHGFHSSHAAILTEGKTVPDGVLAAAAEICAYYSDGRGGTKVPVDYTRRKFVKKPPASNPGFVIYTDYKTILVNPDGHKDERAEQ